MAVESIKGDLQPHHKAACRMRIAGKPNSEICAELGVKPRTLHLWFSDRKFKDYLDELARDVEREFAVELARSGFVALDELTALVQKDVVTDPLSAREKMEIAREILDRHPALAKLRDRADAQRAAVEGANGGVGGGTTNNYLQVFASMPDADLVDWLSRWRDGSQNGHEPETIEGTATEKKTKK